MANPANSLLRVLPEPSVLVDADGGIVQVNRAFLRLIGAERTLGVPATVYELADDDSERVRQYLSACSGSGQMIPGSLTVRVSDGGVLTCRVHGARASDSGGEDPVLILLRFEPRRVALSGFRLLNQKIHQLAREVHTRRLVEEELKDLNAGLEERVQIRTAELYRANQALLEKNRELQDFAFVASHDLQEPLRKIRTFLSIAREEMPPQDAQVEDYFERIDDAAARMSTLIRDLLALTHVSTARTTFRAINLSAIVHAVVRDLETLVSEASARIDVEALPVIHADPVQMRQLFQNLLTNAVKFRRSEAPPHVRVYAVPLDGAAGEYEKRVRIVVEDDGIGFDQAHAERIFAPFQRLHGRGQFAGSGIGLTICRRIVERHGGSISATSERDRGSRFAIVLPVHANDAELVQHDAQWREVI